MDEIKLSQDYLVYTPKKAAVFPIPEADWNRIKNQIRLVVPVRKLYSFFSSLFFGIFVSAGFSIFSLFQVSTVPAWLMPTTICICVSALVLGLALLAIDGQQKEIIAASSKSIIEEMDSIESKFESGRQP